jgi:hypothetical protein
MSRSRGRKIVEGKVKEIQKRKNYWDPKGRVTEIQKEK